MRILAAAGLSLALCIAAFAVPSEIGFAQTESVSITVRTKSDDVNGDISSVAGLQANPGPDGISLREAILATNIDPGSYSIAFDPILDGKVIVALTRMDTLGGGNVMIDGDIDGDDKPDITIRNDVPRDSPYVLEITSSGNRLRDLRLKGAGTGVVLGAAPFFSSPPSGMTYTGNVIRDLVITDVRYYGISLNPGGATQVCERNACDTHNTWADTKILRNRIETTGTRSTGIQLSMGSVIGDHIDGIEIRGNAISLTRDVCEPGFGVNLAAGEGGRGTANNRITGAVVSNNVFRGHAQVGVKVMGGEGDGDGNTIAGVKILNNQIDVGVANRVDCMRMGVFVATGDGATDSESPNVRRPRYPENNLVRDVLIKDNTMRKGSGVRLSAGCCGARQNSIRRVRVVHNLIDVIGSSFPGVAIHANWEGGRKRATEGNRIIDVTVDSNRITITRLGKDFFADGLGGIAIGGGHYTGGTDLRYGKVKNVRIIDNRIDTHQIGINVVGGWGFEPGEAIANVVTRLLIAGNRVLHDPFPEFWYGDAARTKGINFLGGGLDAHRNRVTCVRMRNNVVAGVRNAFTILANYSSPGQDAIASGNVARRSCS